MPLYSNLFRQRPTWQKYLLFFFGLVIAAALIWLSFLFILAFALIGLALSIINQIKLKITGRPMFTGPKHFHRYTNSSSHKAEQSGTVIEGEVIRKED